MGWELILAMVVASALTRSYENSKRRATAAWQHAHERAAQRAEERAKRAQQRADKWGQWYERRAASPTHPIGAARRLGWGLAAAGAACVAGVRGARQGAAEGRAFGARLGRTAAREGWTWGHTLREWRRQRHATHQQHQRAARATDPADTPAGDAGEGKDRRARPGQACADCAEATLDRLVVTADGVWCAACLGARARRRGGVPQDGGGSEPTDPGTEPGPDAARNLPPVMVGCLTCGVAITSQVARDGGGRCPACREGGRTQDFPGAAGGGHDVHHAAGGVVHAEVVDDTENEGSTPVAAELTPAGGAAGLNIDGTGISGADGEGYAGTIAALTQITTMLTQAQQVVTDLGDQLTAASVDAETLQGVNEVADLLESAASGTQRTLAHAQHRHEPVADAVAGAGGSANVADTAWYDNY